MNNRIIGIGDLVKVDGNFIPRTVHAIDGDKITVINWSQRQPIYEVYDRSLLEFMGGPVPITMHDVFPRMLTESELRELGIKAMSSKDTREIVIPSKNNEDWIYRLVSKVRSLMHPGINT